MTGKKYSCLSLATGKKTLVIQNLLIWIIFSSVFPPEVVLTRAPLAQYVPDFTQYWIKARWCNLCSVHDKDGKYVLLLHFFADQARVCNMDCFLTRKSLLSISLLLMIVQPSWVSKSENKIILKNIVQVGCWWRQVKRTFCLSLDTGKQFGTFRPLCTDCFYHFQELGVTFHFGPNKCQMFPVKIDIMDSFLCSISDSYCFLCFYIDQQ